MQRIFILNEVCSILYDVHIGFLSGSVFFSVVLQTNEFSLCLFNLTDPCADQPEPGRRRELASETSHIRFGHGRMLRR